MIQTQESIREEEQKQRAQFDRAQMLQHEMDNTPTIRMDRMISGVVQWDDEGAIYSPELEKIIKPGDLLLIKGSQGMRMEKIVERLMAEPEKKKELLCRQDDGWENR